MEPTELETTAYPGYEEAVKLFQDYCKEKEIDSNVLPWPNPINDNQKNTNAFEMVKVIQFEENGRQLPNALDTSQWKHYPWFKITGSGLSFLDGDGWTTFSLVPARLCNLNSSKIKPIAERFLPIYEILQK